MSNASVLGQTLWSGRTIVETGRLIESFRPDVIHVHNTFPLISPSLCWAAFRAGVPVVQTLHNFRLFCPQAMFLRDGRICEDCLGHLPWRGVVHRCYRESTTQTAALAGMLMLHRGMGTWRNKVTRYIALNAFCREKFIAGGLPASRLSIKPNFVDVAAGTNGSRQGGLFVGRLSPEKGIAVLLTALDLLPDLCLPVIGSGPEQSRVMAHTRVRLLGKKNQVEVLAAMRGASWLVMPSIWYENFPRTLVEAFACGLPVIASRLGAMAELIEDGRTGLLFSPGDADDLARTIAWAESHPDDMKIMGKNARREYEAKYTAERNYRQLMAIYAQAIAENAVLRK
jgi:glycosyltransferase involved in cell wall biosynthesis